MYIYELKYDNKPIRRKSWQTNEYIILTSPEPIHYFYKSVDTRMTVEQFIEAKEFNEGVGVLKEYAKEHRGMFRHFIDGSTASKIVLSDDDLNANDWELCSITHPSRGKDYLKKELSIGDEVAYFTFSNARLSYGKVKGFRTEDTFPIILIGLRESRKTTDKVVKLAPMGEETEDVITHDFRNNQLRIGDNVAFSSTAFGIKTGVVCGATPKCVKINTSNNKEYVVRADFVCKI